MQKSDFKPQVTMPESAEWPSEWEKCEASSVDSVHITFRAPPASEDPKPRRYEVRDAETGEKLSGVSFILTPTGEEMHLLSDKAGWVGPMKDIGIYYHGELHDGMSGANSLPAIRPIALEYVAERIIEQLASLGPEQRHYGHMQLIRRIREVASSKWEEYREENAEFVATKEREEEERMEHYRKMARDRTKNG